MEQAMSIKKGLIIGGALSECRSGELRLGSQMEAPARAISY
jgi:hypothetical protein